jgi:FkbM family methyltransferase
MSFERTKACARKFGLYRPARWARRHIIHREELRALRNELGFYAQFLRPGDLCFDVGANYGAKTEVFLRLGAKVIAFEPQRDCIRELRARLGSHSDLVAINAAVGSISGYRTLYIERHRTASSLVEDWQGEVVGSIEVPVTTLDDSIAKFGVPQHCKIDVEGYELEVLRGLSRTIPTLSFEYHLRKEGETRALDCLDYLSGLGAVLVNISPAEKPLFPRSQWWDKSDFINFFRSAVPQMHGYDYGDIFIKFQ